MSEQPAPRRGLIAPRGRGRRSEADRAKLLQEEAERTRGQDVSNQNRGGKRGQRGRGGVRSGDRDAPNSSASRAGQGSSRRDETSGAAAPAASGPFSLGSIVDPSRNRSFPRPWAPSRRGRTGNAATFGRVKKEGEKSSGKKAVSSGQEGNEDQQSDEDSVSEDDGVQKVDVNKMNEVLIIDDDEFDAFAPIRIDRKQHVDRGLQINPKASGVYIKKEETDGWSQRRKGKQRADVEILGSERRWMGVYQDDNDVTIKQETADDSDIAETQPRIPRSREPESQINIKARRKRIEQKPSTFSTDDDKQEWERWEAEQLGIARLLGNQSILEDMDEAHDHQAAVTKEREDGACLIQLPPFLATLIDESKATVKPSTEDQEETRPPFQPGLVGKLRVYKSGKTSFDWGGIGLEMKKGMTAERYQNVVMITEDEAISLSNVGDKFIVTPDLDEMPTIR
jgi:DNA-directed RNA polymerase III subunit RPC4